MRLAKKKHAEEKDDPTVILALDIKKIWKSLEEFSIPSDAWRRVEDFALPSAYRTCTKVKGKMILMDSINASEAAKLSSVFDEFRTVVQYITGAYMDVSTDIAEDPEQTEKYYEKTCPALLNLWSACVRLTVDCIITLKQHWGETDEYMDLSRTISSTCAMCVKMITVITDVIKLPVPDAQKDAFLECSVDKSTEVCSALCKLLDAAKPDEEGPTDAMMEMVTWSLFSLNHVSCFVIKPLLANGHAESNWFKQYSGALNDMFDKLQSVTDGSSTGVDSQARKETPPPQQAEQEAEPEVNEEGQDKKTEADTKGSKKGDVKGKVAADAQNDETEPDVPPPQQQQTPEILATLDQQYAKFSEEVISTGKVTVCLEDPSDQNVRIFYRPEVHKSLGRCRFGACDMKDRIQWLEEINLSPDQRLVSDIYVIKDGVLKTTSAVEVEVTAVPPQGSARQIIVKVKQGGTWSILEDFDREVLPELVHISFRTNELEALYAYIEEQSDEEEIVPEGCTFKSPTNSKVFINFPHGAVQDPTKVLVKFVSAENDTDERPASKDKSSDSIIGIQGVSDAVEISAKDPSVDIQKNILVQLTIEGDDSDDGKDTHLVVIRYRDDQVQVMDKSQCHITKVENGVYSVQTRGLWCIAIARIKKIFLNMRDTVKKEFLVMFGKVKLCNICTFIDHALRDRERGLTTFWIEIIEKVKVPEVTSDHAQQNLIEVKSSRSKDLIIRQSESLNIQLDGQVRVVGAPLTDKYTLTYLENTDNHLQVPLEIKRDQDKPPNAAFMFKDSTSGQTCHTVSVPIRDLTELATDEITSRPPTKYHDKSNSREELKHRDEAAKNVLSHSSLMCLARAISHAECKRLGTQMGVPAETMQKLWETCEGEATNTNFRILCEWRGKSVRSSMLDFLLNSLRTIGLCSQAAVIDKVSKLGRGILQEDFSS